MYMPGCAVLSGVGRRGGSVPHSGQTAPSGPGPPFIWLYTRVNLRAMMGTGSTYIYIYIYIYICVCVCV